MKKAHVSKCTQAGFTLMELMISLGIFILISGSAFGLLDMARELRRVLPGRRSRSACSMWRRSATRQTGRFSVPSSKGVLRWTKSCVM